MWNFFILFFNLTTMPWICPPAFAPVAPREDHADLVSTLSAKPSSVLQGKDFTFPGCVFVGHIFDHFLFRWRLRRLCLARILTSKKTFRSNNSTSNAKKSYHFTLKLFNFSGQQTYPGKSYQAKTEAWSFRDYPVGYFTLLFPWKVRKQSSYDG